MIGGLRTLVAKLSARRHCQLAWKAFDQGDFPAALALFRRALRTYEPFAPGAEDTATYTNNVGFVSLHLGDLDTALRYYQTALELSEANDLASMNTAGRWNNVGSVLQDLREFDRALRHYETALARYRARTGRTARIEVARCLNNIATARWHPAAGKPASTGQTPLPQLHSLGRINEAIDTLADAIDIAEDIRSRAGGDRSREAVHGAQQDMYTEIQIWLSDRRQDGDAVARESTATPRVCWSLRNRRTS